VSVRIDRLGEATMKGTVKRLVALIVLLGVVLVSVAALRGCRDPTQLDPWVSGEHSLV
jgi:hypothetical protein